MDDEKLRLGIEIVNLQNSVKGLQNLADNAAKSAANFDLLDKESEKALAKLTTDMKRLTGLTKSYSAIVKESVAVNKGLAVVSTEEARAANQLANAELTKARATKMSEQADREAIKVEREKVKLMSDEILLANRKAAADAKAAKQKAGNGAYSQLTKELSAYSTKMKDAIATGKLNDTALAAMVNKYDTLKGRVEDTKNKFAELTGEVQKAPSVFSRVGMAAQVAFGNLIAQAVSQAGFAIRQFIVDSSQASRTMDGIVNTFAAGSGSFTGAAKELDFVRKAANDMGISITDAYQPYAKFLTSFTRSGGSIAQSRQIFSDISAAAVSLHLSGEETKSVYVALEQMANKGTVQMEELKRQLGNSLPGAFELAAESMEMTTAELTDMMKAGKVMSADFLPKFAARVKEVLGGSLPLAVTQAQAEFNRMETDIFDAQVAFGAFANEIALMVVPSIREVIQGFTAFSSNLKDAIPQIQAVSAGIISFTAVLGAGLLVMSNAQKIVTAWTLAVTALGSANVFLNTVYATTISSISAGNLVMAASSAATTTATLAVNGFTAALGVLAAHPIVATLTALAAVVGTVAYNVVKGKSEVENATKAMAESQVKTIAYANSANVLAREYVNLKDKTKLTLNEQNRLSELTTEIKNKYPQMIDFLNKEAVGHDNISKAVAIEIAHMQKLAQVKSLMADQERALSELSSNRWRLSKADENMQEVAILDRTTSSLKEVIRQYDDAVKAAGSFKTATGLGGTGKGGETGKAGGTKGKNGIDKKDSLWDTLSKDISNQEELIRVRKLQGQGIDDLVPRYLELKSKQDSVNKSMQDLIKPTDELVTGWAALKKELKEAEDRYKGMLSNSTSFTTAEIKRQQELMKGLKIQVQYNEALENSEDLMGMSNRAAGQLADTLVDDLFTPLREGETIWSRFKDAGLSALKAIATDWVKTRITLMSKGFQAGWGLNSKFGDGSLIGNLSSGAEGLLQGAKKMPIEGTPDNPTNLASLSKTAQAVAELNVQTSSLAKTAMSNLNPAMQGAVSSMTAITSPAQTAASSVAQIGMSAPTAAMGTAVMALGMTALAPAAKMAAPALNQMAGSLASIAVEAAKAAVAMSELAVATAAESVARIPFVGGLLAPVAALATGTAIATGATLAGAGISAGSAIAGAGQMIGGGLTGVGNLLSGGQTIKHARGGVVSSPTTFPMSGGNIGVAGEAGTEVIAPARRMSNGDVGVGAVAPNVVVNNYSNTAVEVVKRPNNETEIKITELNAMLSSSRTNKGMASAQSRMQSKGKRIG